jgi:methylenetetrahydrofolate dehydrogenase (NADP+)/methenyltetrahydrofolate cyclohydrolase
MSARAIDGRAVAARVRGEVAEGVRAFAERSGRAPGLATVMVGEDPASAVYVGGKQRACAEVGMVPRDERLPASAGENEVRALLEELGAEEAIDGILLQLPLPAALSPSALVSAIDPAKDVDGLTPTNAGLLAQDRPEGLRPCTPLGVMELLGSEGVQLAGAEAVVLGRSNLFGRPMASLLEHADATVTICHSRSRSLDAVCRRADVLVAAVGQPRMVAREWIKEGAIVIDGGISRLTPEEAGNRSGLVGDVDFEGVSAVASAITPVPGGVGPMTIAMLLANTLRAACLRGGVELPPAGARMGEAAAGVAGMAS